MIFIGGIQPKTVTVDETPRICPSCGLAQARLKRMDHYMSLFFIPLFRVHKGETFIFCERCQGPAPESGLRAGALQCPQCDRSLDRAFQFCPHCGTKQAGPEA